MIKKIKKIINEFREYNKYQISLIEESNWANIFHDTIKGRQWMRDLEISPGRWAANYSFLYLITRILSDYKPKRILELGLGESSKLISTFIENEAPDTTYLIIEHSKEWIDVFSSRFQMSRNSRIEYYPLVQKQISGYWVDSYDGLSEKVNEKYDLYIIDGPFGSDRFSRYDIYNIVKKLTPLDEFLIVIDDFDREGERDTVMEMLDYLKKNNFIITTGVYSGIKTQFIIASNAYKYSTSI